MPRVDWLVVSQFYFQLEFTQQVITKRNVFIITLDTYHVMVVLYLKIERFLIFGIEVPWDNASGRQLIIKRNEEVWVR